MARFVPPLSTAEVTAALAGVQDVRDLVCSGQSQVFLAKVTGSGEDAVIKIYYPGSTSERTDREVKGLSVVNNAYVCRLIGSGKGRFRGTECDYVIMNHVSGQSLSDRLVTGPMAEKDVQLLLHGVASGIGAIWAQRIVHRDLKPANIMWSPKGPVVIDLGLARHLDLPSLTTAGTTWGTPGYMSPEQCTMGARLTCKSDVFALGVVAIEALQGSHPTGGDQRGVFALGGSTHRYLQSGRHRTLLRSMLQSDAHLRPSPAQIVAETQP